MSLACAMLIARNASGHFRDCASDSGNVGRCDQRKPIAGVDVVLHATLGVAGFGGDFELSQPPNH
jgi:hypothetical protein